MASWTHDKVNSAVSWLLYQTKTQGHSEWCVKSNSAYYLLLFESCKLQDDQTLVMSTECSSNTSSFNVIKIISYLHTEFHIAYYLQKSSMSYKICLHSL